MKQSLSNMMCLDVYLSSLDAQEYEKIKSQIKPLIAESKPLLSWDISNENAFERVSKAKRRIDIDKIKYFAEKYNWENDINNLFLDNEFEAIVLTDSLEKIMWVNEGFTKMTGYSKSFATNRHPSFLQGEMTSTQKRKEIRVNLQTGKPFDLSVVNYKKNRTTYTCKIQIFPLYSNKVTHFMALETQIR
jgi:PAS domain S-box-containing protein